jgi:hypothetical protein
MASNGAASTIPTRTETSNLQTSSVGSGPSVMSSGKGLTNLKISIGADKGGTPPPQRSRTDLPSGPGAVSRRPRRHRRYEAVSSAPYTWAQSFSRGAGFLGGVGARECMCIVAHNGPPASPADQGLTVPCPLRGSARRPART